MKKLIPILVLLLLVPCALADSITLTISNPEVAQDEIYVDVSISDITNVGKISFGVECRKSILALTGGRAGALVPNGMIRTSRSEGTAEIRMREEGINGSGQIMRLIFTPKKEEEVRISLKNIYITNRKNMKIRTGTTSNEVTYTPGGTEEEAVEEEEIGTQELEDIEEAVEEEEAPPLEEWEEEELPEEGEAPPLEEWEEAEEAPAEVEEEPAVEAEEAVEEEPAAEEASSFKIFSNTYIIVGIAFIVVIAIVILNYIIVEGALEPFKSPLALPAVMTKTKKHPAEPIVPYAKHYMQKGYHEDHIKAHLHKHGWPPHYVEWAIKKAKELI